MNFKIKNIFKGDKVVWMVFFLLCCISILEVFSSSSTLTYKASYWAPVTRHMGFLATGFVLMVLTLNIDCRYFKTVGIFLYPITIFMLIWVLLMGHSTNGASRWISIFGFQFQPSELAKGIIVLIVAKVMSAMKNETEYSPTPRTLKVTLWLSAILILLIGIENFSTAGLLLAVVIAMNFVGGVPLRQLGKVLGSLTILAVIGIIIIFAVGKKDIPENDKQNLTEVVVTEEPKAEKGLFSSIFHRASTWKNRIIEFAEGKEDNAEEYQINDDNLQVSYANIAIAKSDIYGKGPGNSWTRDYLPQAYSDFIYAIILEELGIFGGIFVVFLYLVLLYRAGIIAQRCEHYYPAILAMGLAILMVSQAMFNMMVAVGLAPVTGQPLPFISRGGSSTLMNCIYIGMILSISISAKRRSKESETAIKPTT